ncbi:MAG: Rrf2 family transcriptional regulator [Acetobacteraceae bacterium]|nr:Rrf2 family transcriptional regulator [Acetobacteraceae bacterium]
MSWTVAEIVEHFDVSKGHVMKVVHRLAQLGYVQTLRGKKGGIRLAREPSAITAGGVVRAVEPPLLPLPWSRCARKWLTTSARSIERPDGLRPIASN